MLENLSNPVREPSVPVLAYRVYKNLEFPILTVLDSRKNNCIAPHLEDVFVNSYGQRIPLMDKRVIHRECISL